MTIVILVLIIILFMSLQYGFLGLDNYYTTVLPFIYLLLNIIYLYKYKKGDILSFEFVFAISFFLCCFLTPIILPQMDSYVSRIFLADSNTQYKTYIVCMIGYLFYMLGLITKKGTEEDVAYLETNITLAVYSNYVCTFFLLLFFVFGGSSLLSMYGTGGDIENRLGEWGEYLTYAMIAYTISIITNIVLIRGNNQRLIKIPKLFVLNSVVLLSMLAFSGYRSNLIQLILPLVWVYDKYYKKIEKWKMVLLLILAMCFLVYSGLTRQGSSFDFQSLDMLTLFRDFSAANAANAYLINYADSNGVTYGSNWILQILSIIPFLQSVFVAIFGRGFISESSSRFFTDQMDSLNSGLGTGIIGDIYYSTGLLGVCVLMFLLGVVCKKLSNCDSFIKNAMFLVFLGNAMFASRVEYFYIARMMAFSAILMWALLKLSGTKNKI